MMKFNILFFILSVVGLAACAQPSPPRPTPSYENLKMTDNATTYTAPKASTAQATVSPTPQTTVDDEHNAENSLDWAGTYSGKTPEYVVMLLALHDNQRYALKTETKSKQRRITQGTFQWEKGGSIIRLDNQMRFFVGEGRVQQLPQGVNTYQEHSPYTLNQISDIPAEISE